MENNSIMGGSSKKSEVLLERQRQTTDIDREAKANKNRQRC